MKEILMSEFDNLDEIDKIIYAYQMKWGYYKFYRIKKQKRKYRFLDRKEFCPFCKSQTNIVTCGFMNAITPFGKLIEHPRCEYCLLKLPVIDRVIRKLLGYTSKPKELPEGQLLLSE